MRNRNLRRIDRALFLLALAAVALLFGRANLLADAVDYYANLQRLSPAAGQPIVRNLHFADQRSPGFSIAALPVHLVPLLFGGLLALAVALRRAYPDLPGYSLAVLILPASPILLENVIGAPLYATLTAFGAAALFCAAFARAAEEGRLRDGLAAGCWLGPVAGRPMHSNVILTYHAGAGNHHPYVHPCR